MRPVLRRVWCALAAGLMLLAIPADAQIRPSIRSPRRINWSTRRVNIEVKLSDYDIHSGTATVTVPRAIVGYVRDRSRPWIMFVRADPFFELKRHGMSTKPCSEMAIRFEQGNADYRQLSPRNQLAAYGGIPEGRDEVTFGIKFAAHPEDVAGEYSIELYFEYTEI